MSKRFLRTIIYSLLALLCTFCASKKKELKTNNRDNSSIEALQERISDLEYIIKNRATGEEFINEQFSLEEIESSTKNNSSTIQLLKSKISYLEKELSILPSLFMRLTEHVSLIVRVAHAAGEEFRVGFLREGLHCRC